MLDRTVGQYKITDFIASGGMADVYKAYDEGLDRDVALKILFPQYSRDEEFIERFQREARSAASLRHPNIVQIYSTGITDNGDHYIAMEYVPDGTLESVNRNLTSEGKLIDTARVLVLMRQVADALGEAHERGIVHRDLKPSNILLRGNNVPVLTDLGIALSGKDPRLTLTNRMMGTPDYMSPEQAETNEVDGRSDIYSFGIMLYELLCGRRPFGDESPWMIVHKQINEEPKDLAIIRPGLAPQLYETVKRCMAKNPDLRYQTTRELIKAIDEAIMASGESTGYSGEWEIVSLDAAGVMPLTGMGGMGRLKSTSSSEPYIPATTVDNIYTETAAGPSTSDPSRIFQWGLSSVLVALVLAVGGLGGYLLSTVNREPIEATSVLTAEPTDLPIAQITPTEAAVIIMEEETATPTATDTPEPTETPTATATATSTSTQTPTLPPTATATATQSAAETVEPEVNTIGEGNGLPVRFENDDFWTISGNAGGELVVSNAQAYDGQFSGQVNYEFTTGENEVLTMTQINPMRGRPDTVSVRVYGDGSGHQLFAIVVDAKNQRWQIPLGIINHQDRWAFMSGSLGTENRIAINQKSDNVLDYPVTFYSLQLSDIPESFVGSGTIYIDDLQSLVTGATVEPSTPTPESIIIIEVEEEDTPEPNLYTISIPNGYRCDDGVQIWPHNRTIEFKWTSNVNQGELPDGYRFVLTIYGGNIPINDGRAVFESFSTIPGEWSVFVDPTAINVKKDDSYRWRVELRTANEQILVSREGCFDT